MFEETWYVLNILKFIKIYLVSNIWFMLENVTCTLQKKVHSVAFYYDILYMYVIFIWPIRSYKTIFIWPIRSYMLRYLIFLNLKNLFIQLCWIFTAVWALSSCGKQGLLWLWCDGLLVVVAFRCRAWGLGWMGFSICGTWTPVAATSKI